MNTILTNDERRTVIKSVRHGLFTDPVPDDVARAIEAAVLAKLAQQEPVASVRTWHKNGDQHAELDDWGLGLASIPDGTHNLYTHPAPQQADRQRAMSNDIQAACDAYDRLDRLLRKKLGDEDYAYYSRDLDLIAPQQSDRQRVPDGWVNAVQKIADENEVDPSFVTMVFDDLLPVFMADKDAAGYVTLPLDSLIESDSYDVYGSDFYRCKVCGAESGAGVLNKGIQHNHNCPLAAALAQKGGAA